MTAARVPVPDPDDYAHPESDVRQPDRPRLHLSACRTGSAPCSLACGHHDAPHEPDERRTAALEAELHADDHGPACRCGSCLEDRR